MGQDIDENVLTNEICSWFETDQSQDFAVCVSCGHDHPTPNARVSLVNCLRLHLGLYVCPWSVRVKDKPPF